MVDAVLRELENERGKLARSWKRINEYLAGVKLARTDPSSDLIASWRIAPCWYEVAARRDVKADE